MSFKVTSSGMITIGDIVDINHTVPTIMGGYMHGWSPLTTDIPNLFMFSEYKNEINSFSTVDDISMFTKLDSLSYQNYNSIDEIKTAYYETYPEIDENVLMLWGNLYEGGLALAKVDNNTCVMICCRGVNLSSGYLHPQYTYNNCPYQVTITNNIPAQTLSELSANVQTTGIYENGFFICRVWEMDYSTGSALQRDAYRVFMGAIACVQNQKNEYTEVTFYGSAPNCISDYLNNYASDLPAPAPDSTWGVVNYNYIDNRQQQRRFYTLPVLVFDYDASPTYEGTNVFGGAESEPPEEPYSPSSTSSSGGGYNGEQTRYSEPNGDEGLPSDNGLDTGFFALYNPSKSELQDFTSFLYAGITDNIASVIKRILVNPLDGVLTAHMVHFQPPSSSMQTIYFCGFSSGCQANVISTRWHEIKYQFSFNKKTILMFDTFHDLNEKTKMSLFLPYSGMHEMNINEFLNGVMTVTYKIDMLSGDCYIQVESKTPNIQDGTLIDSVVYTFTGNCASPVPLSAVDYRNFLNASIGAVGSAMSGNPIGVAASIANVSYGIAKSGSVTCNTGYLGKQTPFIVIHHPEVSIPSNFENYKGYPSNITAKIKNAGDFVKASQSTVWTTKIHCTDKEMEMIKELFYEGVWCKI